jgi:LAIKA domain
MLRNGRESKLLFLIDDFQIIFIFFPFF